jgi:thioredoxin-like negative regulator of GroEL
MRSSREASESATMKAKIRLIKKEDRNGPPPAVESQATTDPKDWSTAVKSWVTEFQKDRETESLEAFDSLFSDPIP